jgi:hypothetical protein
VVFATPISWFRLGVAGCLGLFAGADLAPAASSDTNTPVAFARRNLEDAQKHYRAAPGEGGAAWEFGRACFDLAEFATNNTERASLADQGVAACRLAVARASNSAPAHYYLAMNLGQLARTKGLGALKLVSQMEREFTRARELDARLHYAGPDRNLGQLYRDAPTIASVGSRPRAREHLKRAVELVPGYPENRLILAESYLKWGERTGASRELQALEAAWPSARTNLVGVAWAASWADWLPRFYDLKKQLEPHRKPLSAPRDNR